MTVILFDFWRSKGIAFALTSQEFSSQSTGQSRWSDAGPVRESVDRNCRVSESENVGVIALKRCGYDVQRSVKSGVSKSKSSCKGECKGAVRSADRSGCEARSSLERSGERVLGEVAEDGTNVAGCAAMSRIWSQVASSSQSFVFALEGLPERKAAVCAVEGAGEQVEIRWEASQGTLEE